MKIGDNVYVHGYVDEIRKDTVIIRNKGGYFGTVPSEIICGEIPQPQRKIGRWIPVTNGRGGYECDQCHKYAPSYQNGDEHLSNFCPYCGADMRTPVEIARNIVHEVIDNSVWSDAVDTAEMHKVVDDKYAEIRGDANADVES